MRNIAKGSEPKCLAEHRRTPHSGYDNLPTACKDELKRRMRGEQGGLCCYCMSRVTAENGHIEHWHPQSKSGDGKRDLEYANLLLACDGGANGGCLHCDASKGNKLLKFNPADSRHNVESRIRYHANGRVECSGDAEFNRQIQHALNLNAAHLVAARAKVVEETRKRTGGCNLSELTKMRKQCLRFRDDGDLPQFCMTMVYYIDKKIKKREFQKNSGRK